jgi:hypothetical protein
VALMGSKFNSSHEIWTKIEETFGGSTSLEVDLPFEKLSLKLYIIKSSKSLPYPVIKILRNSQLHQHVV